MVTVIDYDAGNLRSVETALRRVGVRFHVTSLPSDLKGADRIILPGVGDARAAMDRLRDTGLADALAERVAQGVPTLGICLGSQIILERSQENDAKCLGFLQGETIAFDERPGRKVPHMGWNSIDVCSNHPIFNGIPQDASFYFVHSYYPQPTSRSDILATTEYGEQFASAVGRNNVVATQFHPEKSGEFGLEMLENFIAWQGDR